MELLLIRHGLPERVINEDGSPADPNLSETGLDQAERVGRWLEAAAIDRIYASPMRRAVQTAQPLANKLSLDIEIERAVREYDAESELYIPMEELKEHDYERWKALVSGGYAPDVDFRAFHREVLEGIERIIEDNAKRRVAVFCHGGVINAWASHVLGLEPKLFVDVTYTSINRFFAASTGERSLASLNEASHLRS